jgi:hypothetical protein
MPVYYTTVDARATSASAATQLQVARMSTAARQAAISRVVVGGKGASYDQQVLHQLWRPTTAPTGGTTQAAQPHDASSSAATTVYATSATAITAGAKGAFPVVSLPFNGRAMVQWVALNPDEAITMVAAAVAATGNMELWNETGVAVSQTVAFDTTWYE